MRILLALFVGTLVTWKALASESPKSSVVPLSEFKKGNSWSWQYSSRDTSTGVWKPYLVETYVLTDVQEKILTFEMHSSPLPFRETQAHHKFVVDFTDCEKAALDGPRGWKMRFYTHSFGPEWTLVSNNYENLAFTEKFNCNTPRAKQTVRYLPFDLNGEQVETSAPPQISTSGDSFYFVSAPDLIGVAAQKTFSPAKNYKFEFSAQVTRYYF
jgi:hypothetical protein